MPRGENLHPLFRSSHKRYTERPPANCRSAREAWDRLANPERWPIACLFLHDGYWQAQFEDGSWDDAENTFGVNRALRSQDARRVEAQIRGALS